MSNEKISFVQIERIESEIRLEKKNMEQKIKKSGKNHFTKTDDLTKKSLDYSYSPPNFEHHSYEKFRQWSNVLEDELSVQETSDTKNLKNRYFEDGL